MVESGALWTSVRDPSMFPLAAGNPHFPARAKRIIHLLMKGGPSQIDTFHPKHNLQVVNGRTLADSLSDAL